MKRTVLLLAVVVMPAVTACSSGSPTAFGTGPCAQVTDAQWSALYPAGAPTKAVAHDDRCEIPVGSADSAKLTLGRLIQPYNDRLASATTRGDQPSLVPGVADDAFFDREVGGSYAEVSFMKHGHAYYVNAWFGNDTPSGSDDVLQATLTQIAATWAATMT